MRTKEEKRQCMQENFELVQRGFRILVASESGYVGQELNKAYKGKWWEEVLDALSDQRDLPKRWKKRETGRSRRAD